MKLSLSLLALSVLGCVTSRTVQVTTYEQGKKLAEAYSRNYNSRRKQAAWVGPTAAYTRFRRTNAARPAIVLGQIFIIEPNGGLTPSIGIVKINETVLQTDDAGKYSQELAPGQYCLFGGMVDFLRSYAPPLRVQQGDSIRIDFQILPEFRATMN